MKAEILSAARLLVASAAIAALASCGGGSGDGGGMPPSSTTVPSGALMLTATNGQNVAGDATLASLDASGAANPFTVAAAGVQDNTLPTTHVLGQLMSQQVDLLDALLQQPSVISAAVQTLNCPSGGNLTVDIASPASTSALVTFNACSEFAGRSVSGTLAVSNIMRVNGAIVSASVSANLTFSRMGFTDRHLTGSFNVSKSTAGTITLSGTEILIQAGTNTERLLNFSFVSTFNSPNLGDRTDRVTLTFASTKIGGSVMITTTTPFQTSAGRNFPHTGVIEIVGASGSRIRVTVLGDETLLTTQVRIQIDANGNGNFETTLNKNWSDLTA